MEKIRMFPQKKGEGENPHLTCPVLAAGCCPARPPQSGRGPARRDCDTPGPGPPARRAAHRCSSR